MSGELNPYESPQTPSDDIGSVAQVPTLNVVFTFLVGSLLGILSFMPAIALIPSDVPDPSVHDLRLANNLGFIYPVVLGLWSAWLRRSWQWAGIGIVAGLGIGIAYYVLCGYDFLSVMVAFPCLLGGGAAVVLGRGTPSWIKGAPLRRPRIGGLRRGRNNVPVKGVRHEQEAMLSSLERGY